MFSSLKVLTKPRVWLQICVQSIAEKKNPFLLPCTLMCTWKRKIFFKSRKTFMCALRQRRRKKKFLNQMKIVTEEFEQEKSYLMLKIKFSCHNSISLDGALQEMKSFLIAPRFLSQIGFFSNRVGGLKIRRTCSPLMNVARNKPSRWPKSHLTINYDVETED